MPRAEVGVGRRPGPVGAHLRKCEDAQPNRCAPPLGAWLSLWGGGSGDPSRTVRRPRVSRLRRRPPHHRLRGRYDHVRLNLGSHLGTRERGRGDFERGEHCRHVDRRGLKHERFIHGFEFRQRLGRELHGGGARDDLCRWGRPVPRRVAVFRIAAVRGRGVLCFRPKLDMQRGGWRRMSRGRGLSCGGHPDRHRSLRQPSDPGRSLRTAGPMLGLLATRHQRPAPVLLRPRFFPLHFARTPTGSASEGYAIRFRPSATTGADPNWVRERGQSPTLEQLC